ncbi:MAG: hypothetical protein HZB26_20980 [Candidatus Hydrogenedentes bacterium]|nr:hypothetical protein [Candidatus Hydrogenedentota bacterium]
MHAEDRSIHFSTELIHAPVQYQVPALQKLYYELGQTRTAAYDSSDFSVPGRPQFHSKRPPRSQSVAVFLPDRIVLIEEWADGPLSAFIDKVKEVSARTLGDLGPTEFVAQTVTLRSTFGLTHFADARAFLLDHVCSQEGRLAPHFRRPIGVGGMRFMLPETPEHQGNFQVIIESFQQSVNDVFVEVKGIFAQQHITAESLFVAIHHIQDVRAFIVEHVFPYLNQFDRAK